jgi:phosphoserine phosphatase
MPRSIIALIFDFDITLSPDFQQQVLFDHWGIRAEEFWAKASKNMQQGYDMEHGYLKALVDMGKENKKYQLSNHDLYEFGKKVELYDGLSRKNNQRSIFDDLNDILKEERYQEHQIKLECYCISGGLLPMIQGAFEAHRLNEYFQDLFACSLDEDEQGVIAFPKETVGHTIKTQKIFMIKKGTIPSLGRHPTEVNEVDKMARIPFENMIFLGDGQTDIPAFSLINHYGGTSIALYRESKKADGSIDEEATAKTYEEGYKLAIESKRAEQLINADYSQGKPLKMALLHYVRKIANRIVDESLTTD